MQLHSSLVAYPGTMLLLVSGSLSMACFKLRLIFLAWRFFLSLCNFVLLNFTGSTLPLSSVTMLFTSLFCMLHFWQTSSRLQCSSLDPLDIYYLEIFMVMDSLVLCWLIAITCLNCRRKICILRTCITLKWKMPVSSMLLGSDVYREGCYLNVWCCW